VAPGTSNDAGDDSGTTSNDAGDGSGTSDEAALP
jgi:hypothetical protein